MNAFRVIVCAVLVIGAAFAPTFARAERSPEDRAAKIVLLPESGRPVWNWLLRVTAPNDPFVSRTAAASYQRAWPPQVLYGYLFDPFVSPAPPLHAARFGFTVGSDRWWVVADRKRHLVYYGESCCSYARAVVTTYDTPPPRDVPEVDLWGPAIPAQLGDAPTQVYAALGEPLRRWTSAKTSRWAAAYAHPWWSDEMERRGNPGNPCAYDITAIFARERLVGYEVWRGC